MRPNRSFAQMALSASTIAIDGKTESTVVVTLAYSDYQVDSIVPRRTLGFLVRFVTCKDPVSELSPDAQNFAKYLRFRPSRK